MIKSLQLCSSLADRLAHWWQEGKVEIPGEPLSLSDSGSENCICFGQILRIKLFYFAAISSLDPATNFRTHSMGTSTKDDDRAKILPGVEGALHLRYLGNNLAFLISGCLTSMR